MKGIVTYAVDLVTSANDVEEGYVYLSVCVWMSSGNHSRSSIVVVLIVAAAVVIVIVVVVVVVVD